MSLALDFLKDKLRLVIGHAEDDNNPFARGLVGMQQHRARLVTDLAKLDEEISEHERIIKALQASIVLLESAEKEAQTNV